MYDKAKMKGNIMPSCKHEHLDVIETKCNSETGEFLGLTVSCLECGQVGTIKPPFDVDWSVPEVDEDNEPSIAHLYAYEESMACESAGLGTTHIAEKYGLEDDVASEEEIAAAYGDSQGPPPYMRRSR